MKPANRGLSLAVVGSALAFVLGGCVTYEPRPLKPESSATAWSARSLSDPGLRRFVETGLDRRFETWPPPRWDFPTLTLVAFYEHPDLDVARARWGTARAGQLTARQRPTPSASFQPEYDSSAPPPWILGQSFDVPVETAGKRGYRIAEAAQLSEAARLSIASTAWHIRSRLRGELIAWNAADRSLRALRQQETGRAEAVRLLEGQLRLGAVSGFEASQARLALRETQLRVQDAEQRRTVARTRVAAALGLSAEALGQAEFDLEDLERLPRDPADADTRRQALVNRADLRAALAEYAAADASLRLEIARQYPDLHFGPGYQLDQTDNKWSLGLTFDLPLPSRHRGPIAEAEARREELATAFGALQADVLSQVEQALAAYRGALQQAETARQILDEVQGQEGSARAMMDAGEIAPLTVVEKQVELAVASLAEIDATEAAQQALGTLEDALQSPLGLPSSIWEQAPRPSSIGREEVP